MSKDELMEFIERILKEDTVSEFVVYGFIEKVIANINIIKESKLCLN